MSTLETRAELLARCENLATGTPPEWLEAQKLLNDAAGLPELSLRRPNKLREGIWHLSGPRSLAALRRLLALPVEPLITQPSETWPEFRVSAFNPARWAWTVEHPLLALANQAPPAPPWGDPLVGLTLESPLAWLEQLGACQEGIAAACRALGVLYDEEYERCELCDSATGDETVTSIDDLVITQEILDYAAAQGYGAELETALRENNGPPATVPPDWTFLPNFDGLYELWDAADTEGTFADSLHVIWGQVGDGLLPYCPGTLLCGDADWDWDPETGVVGKGLTQIEVGSGRVVRGEAGLPIRAGVGYYTRVDPAREGDRPVLHWMRDWRGAQIS